MAKGYNNKSPIPYHPTDAHLDLYVCAHLFISSTVFCLCVAGWKASSYEEWRFHHRPCEWKWNWRLWEGGDTRVKHQNKYLYLASCGSSIIQYQLHNIIDYNEACFCSKTFQDAPVIYREMGGHTLGDGYIYKEADQIRSYSKLNGIWRKRFQKNGTIMWAHPGHIEVISPVETLSVLPGSPYCYLCMCCMLRSRLDFFADTVGTISLQENPCSYPGCGHSASGSRSPYKKE